MIYLIAGRARSGKNTLKNYMLIELKKRGKKVCDIEIMRTLKGYCRDYFGWDGNDETKPRDLLQKLGTEIIRENMNRPLFHINRLIEDIEILSNFFNDFIVDDVRFPLEIEKIKEHFPDTISISIVRDSYQDDGLTFEQRKHITETALNDFDNYDVKIFNTTLSKLQEDAEKLIREVDKNEKNDK